MCEVWITAFMVHYMVFKQPSVVLYPHGINDGIEMCCEMEWFKLRYLFIKVENSEKLEYLNYTKY